MNKYFLDENDYICETSDKDPTKSRELLKFQACERLNKLNNKVISLEAQISELQKYNNLSKSDEKLKKNAQKTAKIEILQDVKAVFNGLNANARAKMILGYIDKKIEMLSKQEANI